MYKIVSTKRYDKSFKKLKHSGNFNENEVNKAVEILASGKKLEANYMDHPLHGKYLGYRECHIRGDVLLIYKIENKILILVLFDIGSHSELF
ncbi:type II toxin-antitoxin system YafQ family toxin [Candidatus Nomurabacteria bacterium]|nr:type II toxin-antitoxin system YafQ family toxin [Candidatus Nomurabacteria bacterium]